MSPSTKVFFQVFTGLSLLGGFVFSQAASFTYSGQLALFSTYNFYERQDYFSGFSLIPEIGYSYSSETGNSWDGIASIKLLSRFNHLDSRDSGDGKIRGDLYRLWLRYAWEHGELRLGLQKIDFGVATIIRPLQWFTLLDYEDPLQETPGVWGILFRYYFLNNTNLWLWGLYGNKSPRGLDIFPGDPRYPEAGGRIQFSIPLGETALSFHYRTAQALDELEAQMKNEIPEIRVGWEGKWDLGVGVWGEWVLIHKFGDGGDYQDLTLILVGIDYTFPWGNGYNFVWENLVSSYDPYPFAFDHLNYVGVMSHSYPIGLDDRIYLSGQYRWPRHDYQLSIGWEHQWQRSALNLIAYYQSRSFVATRIQVFWRYHF